MKHIIIGTAGHVDHGKTALIKALTGTDTDRLEEEKQRGISIDLGFASIRLNGEIAAGIVDVPGHERFLRNMLAGTGGIDMVMLVIAADEGVMPQTKEHLAMLQLFGIKQGVVVINKVDKVDGSWLELVEEEIRELLTETFLADAPFCRVSAITGEGLADLREKLLAAALAVPARDSEAPFRLWVDRAFSIKGHGLVVTGSVLSGSAAIGDSLTLYPAGDLLRVRGLEWHGSKADKVYAGQRAALNLSGDSQDIDRGMVLSSPARGLTSDSWDIIADWQQEITSGTRIRLHIGTAEIIGRVYQFKNRQFQYARLLLEKNLSAGLGDRGIIRLYSPQYLLGGAVLIAPSRQSRKISAARIDLSQAVADNSIDKIIYSLIEDGGQPDTSEELKRKAGYSKDKDIDRVLKQLVANKELVHIGGYYLTTDMLRTLTEVLTAIVNQYHVEQPDRKGLSKDILRQKLHLKEKPWEVMLAYWQKAGLLVLSGAEVALQEFAVKHSDWRQSVVIQAQSALAGLGLLPVEQALLMEKLNCTSEKARSIQDTLVREGLLLKIGDMLFYDKVIKDAARLVKKHLANNPTITVAILRDMLGTSRKVALPLMEYFDSQKYTIREGDNRRAGPKLKDLAE